MRTHPHPLLGPLAGCAGSPLRGREEISAARHEDGGLRDEG